MKAIVVAALILTAILPCAAQSVPDRTFGLVNGRWWKAAPAEVKLGFVIGYCESHTVQVAISHDRNDSIWFRTDTAYGEISQALTEFYHEPSNAAMPINAAWQIIVLKFNGVSTPDLQRIIDSVRKGVIDNLSQKTNEK